MAEPSQSDDEDILNLCTLDLFGELPNQDEELFTQLRCSIFADMTICDIFQELADQHEELSVQPRYSEFQYFHLLPAELRVQIWEKSMERQSRTFVFLTEGPKLWADFHHYYRPPAAHAINRESRVEVFRRFLVFPQVYYDTRKANSFGYGYELVKKYISIRPDIDILRMTMNPFAFDSLRRRNQPSPESPYKVSVDWPTIFRRIQNLEIEGEVLRAHKDLILRALKSGAFQQFDSLRKVKVIKHEVTFLSKPQDPEEINEAYATIFDAFNDYFQWRHLVSSCTIKPPKIEIIENKS
ncbi:hypothetical protein GLAREA_11054 [Glarea lozoyensis ATCC 20868]|uniref:2EXR domain-containing protein n=1 Tax=Glarea lozoyensis (strain ATCC 20868 / MF5171) TaxID=1116229 RepID=S3DCB0_GLAL2|nr:uncharacterized protein GLAREA_11054 [Glarea lozoyensis ATCC 20868]EPE35355.1 hypothetical protein GLAREA_11054 [Glarea lozoyensis ATCC 20868]